MSYVIAIVLLGLAAGVGIVAVRRVTGARHRERLYAQLREMPTYAKDFTTPQGAILCLEDAYRRRDLKAAVACKDFGIEAKMMLGKMKWELASDAQIMSETAKTLELAFGKELSERWPDFEGQESFFVERREHAEDIVAITEVCRFPDGYFSRQEVLVAYTPNGWRVLIPISG